MPGLKHSAEERARLEAIAIEMRKRGEDMQSVVEATGVSIATLYRWAREHRWRAEDMPHARNGGGPLTDTPTGPTQPNDMAQQPGAAPLPSVTDPPSGTDTSPTAPPAGFPTGDPPSRDAVASARQAMQMTANALAANNLAEAERAARLAQRLMRIAEQAPEGLGADPKDDDYPLADPVLPPDMGAEEALETLSFEKLPMALKRVRLQRLYLMQGMKRRDPITAFTAWQLYPPNWTLMLADRVLTEYYNGEDKNIDRIFNRVFARAESPEQYEARVHGIVYDPAEIGREDADAYPDVYHPPSREMVLSRAGKDKA
ncbi:hypothetical protein [Maricaulis sp.]|uniref:hypothetical protein n=1 Tax=Maricaulis sp. TaxID=1486257 RepID=UPI001B15E42A|nr:hypothetical protein [Maricaulis sp.]MBO6797503.1 hypothetical protein [Maricaulis sp.]